LSSQIHLDETLVRREEDLVSFLAEGFKPSDRWVIGTEHEKFGWWIDRGTPPDYFDPRGIGAVLDGFTQYGWVPSVENGTVVALSRAGATITLEPGGQLELSGAPLRSLLETERELDDHLRQLAAISEPLGLSWSGLGLMPWGEPHEMPRMPKPRYDILEKQLNSAGKLGIHMMRQTATVQANYDFSDEADAMKKWRAALCLQPVITAIFAASPIVNGQLTDFQSYRGHVWLDTDDARCKVPDSLLGPSPTLQAYVAWTLDVPMLFLHRDNRYQDCRGRTFRTFMRDGFSGHRANVGDYALHLSTIFPDVRLKQFLEVRGADMGSRAYTLALPAIHAGILYDEQALAQTLDLFKALTPQGWRTLRQDVPRRGYGAAIDGFEIGELADEVLRLACEGLNRWEPGATHLLEPLLAEVSERRCPADRMRESYTGQPGEVLAQTRLMDL